MSICPVCKQQVSTEHKHNNNSLLRDYIYNRVDMYDRYLSGSNMYQTYAAIRNIITLRSNRRIKGSTITDEQLIEAKRLVDEILPVKHL